MVVRWSFGFSRRRLGMSWLGEQEMEVDDNVFGRRKVEKERGVYLTTEVNEGQVKGGHEAECIPSCSLRACDYNKAQAAARACFSMCSSSFVECNNMQDVRTCCCPRWVTRRPLRHGTSILGQHAVRRANDTTALPPGRVSCVRLFQLGPKIKLGPWRPSNHLPALLSPLLSPQARG